MGDVATVCFFFFNDTATTEIYTLSLHDALPIFPGRKIGRVCFNQNTVGRQLGRQRTQALRLLEGEDTRETDIEPQRRSEEHTSELQSRQYLVCRLLLEKKKTLPISYLSPTTPLI